jgi:hypothetical protein
VKRLMEIRRQGEPKGLHYPDWMRQTVITDWLIVDTISFGRNNFSAHIFIEPTFDHVQTFTSRVSVSDPQSGS